MNKDKALELALEALGQLWLFGDEAAVIANPAITAIKQARSAPAQEPVAGCACRWNEEGDRTVTCMRHQGWLEVISEWADRAREAEAKLKATPPVAQPAPVQDSDHEFKNFHRLLCERFGYTHDEVDWKRDQISLLEWIAKQVKPAAPVQEPLEYWNAVEGWVKIDEVREHFDSVGCGTIYKTAGDGRVPLTAAQRQWVGLTDEEILKLAYPIRWQEVDDFEADKAVNFAQMVEAKLKEKNNG